MRFFVSIVAAAAFAAPALAVNPSGVIAKDCAIELMRYCPTHANPSSHADCLETRVKEFTSLCEASMRVNNIRRK